MDLTLLPVGNGRLGIGHRPRRTALPELRRAGVTHVVTLLGSQEGAEDLIGRIEEAGLVSLWLPLAGARPIDDPDRIAEIGRVYDELTSLLDRGDTVFLHCSAGIHRTGMIAYGLLRHLGLAQDEARELLGRLRPDTLAGVTESRLRWGDQFAADDDAEREAVPQVEVTPRDGADEEQRSPIRSSPTATAI